MSSHMSSEGAPKKPHGSRLKGLSVQRHGHDVGEASAPPEFYGRRAAQSSRGRLVGAPGARGSGFLPEDFLSDSMRDVQKKLNKPLRIMKFGGTSVGDASCITKVTDIIRAASCESDIVVVVSAMSGVTNKLIEAAIQSEAGNREAVASIFAELRKRHDAAANALIHSDAKRTRISQQMQALFQAGERLCEGTTLLGELTPRARDSISSLGERLSAPLVAAVLAESGVDSECIEATELVVTDSYYGGAEPWMDLTRESCEARMHPLLQQGIVPVVTGFIGATEEGALTTLGRGGSDYSATILGAALDADEVIIWTDVDGLLTADPRLVPDACTIPEISYREAAELAYFGARVLHPKTLRPVMQRGIPLRICNTFEPEKPGTQITPAGPANRGGITALTAISDAALIAIGGPGLMGVQDVLGRTFATAAAVRADVLLISQSSSQNDVCLVVSSAVAKRCVEALRHEFAHDLAHEKVEHITLDSNVAIVTVVGQKVRGMSGIVGRTFGALGRQNVDIIAISHGASECNISFVVAKKDMEAALVATHQEFQLGELNSSIIPVGSADRPTSWYYGPERASADAD
jgi:aspartokinase/homoserine dehydrogenase 1